MSFACMHFYILIQLIYNECNFNHYVASISLNFLQYKFVKPFILQEAPLLKNLHSCSPHISQIL